MCPARPLVVLLSAAALSAQTTIVVSGGGAALQQAIQAAAPGDTLDVLPGQYDPITCSKGLVIALRPGAEVGTSFLSLATAMAISGLPMGEQLVVEGGRVGSIARGISVTGCDGSVVVAGVDVQTGIPIDVSNCPGPVTFDGLYRSSSLGFTHGPATISGSAQVSFHECTLPMLVVDSSHVAVSGGDIVPYGSSSGVQLQSGSLAVTGGHVVGAQLAGWPVAAPGITVAGGELTLTGGALVEATAAAVMLGSHPAIATTGGSVRIDPSVILVGLPITGPASVTTLPIPSLVAGHAGSTLSVDVLGEPGSVVFTFASLPRPALSTPWGHAWLLPSDPVLDVAVLPASGSSSFVWTAASVPPYVVLVLQSAALATNGSLVVGAPTRFVWN